MVAALSMYDMAHQTEANDAFWQAIRSAYGQGPAALTREQDLWAIWTDPELVLAQTCGLPYRARLSDQVQLLGTPDYGLPECQAGYYYSVCVTHRDGPKDLTQFDTVCFAYNDRLSQSGWGAPQETLGRLGLTVSLLPPTGSHLNSARCVAEGDADLAALDAVTWRNLTHAEPELVRRLKPIVQTSPTPGLPLITGPQQDATALAQAVREGIARVDPAHLAVLGIQGFVSIPKAAYLALPLPPSPPIAPNAL